MRASIAAGLLVAGCSFDGSYPRVTDGGAIDAPADAARDGAIDASGDARPDATVDARPDARPDAMVDARPDAMIDASPPDAPACPAGYAAIAGGPATSSYRTGTAAQWVTAEADCENDGFGTHLVVIDDAAEMAAVDALQLGTQWVGASDRITEGTFLAVTGGPAPFLPWNPGQPDDFFGQDCVSASENGRFGDAQCGGFRQFVCECDRIPPDPAAY